MISAPETPTGVSGALFFIAKAPLPCAQERGFRLTVESNKKRKRKKENDLSVTPGGGDCVGAAGLPPQREQRRI
jgi:hypothetical protein